MRFDLAFIAATLLSTAAANIIDPQTYVAIEDPAEQDGNDLFKRKGGGGGGGRGGSSGGSSGGSKGGSSGGSGGSGSGSSGSRGNTASGSNLGGTSRGGSGAPRSYGGGSSYGGGAATPYRPGVAGALGVGAFALAATLAFWPGLWLYGAYLYPHRDTYTFYNSTTKRTERLPVVCACDPYAVCGCGENNATMNELVGDGSYATLNKSLINVGVYQGRKTLLVNGTLPNGTTADGPDSSGPGSGMKTLAEAAGMWPVVACVLAATLLI